MKITVSLKENHVFRRLYQKGRTAADSRLAIYVRQNGRRENRLGLTVSAKLGHAVVRNRVRRRLREIYRLHEDQLVRSRDVVIVARRRAVDSSYAQLERSFLRLAEETGLLAGQKKENRGERAEGL